MTNEITDPLAERYRAAFDQTDRTRKSSEVVRAEWIEATLELAEVIVQATSRYPDTNTFSHWLARNDLPMTTPAERSALRGFARDPEAARKILQGSTSYAWRTIWEKRERRPPSETGRGPPAPHSRKSGRTRRQKSKRIPDVMQEPGWVRPVRPVVPIRALTIDQVDADFKGTAVEAAAKYGPVMLHTKAQIEHNKRQEVLQKYVGAGLVFAKAETPDAVTLAEWAAKRGKAAKLHDLLTALRGALDRLELVLPEQNETGPDLPAVTTVPH